MPTMKCLIHNVLLLSVAKKNKTKKTNFGTKFNTICLTIVFFFNEENIALTVIIEKEMEIY